MVKERINVTLEGEGYLEKFRELKLADRDLLLASKSKIVKIAFEHFYRETLKRKLDFSHTMREKYSPDSLGFRLDFINDFGEKVGIGDY